MEKPGAAGISARGRKACTLHGQTLAYAYMDDRADDGVFGLHTSQTVLAGRLKLLLQWGPVH